MVVPPSRVGWDGRQRRFEKEPDGRLDPLSAVALRDEDGVDVPLRRLRHAVLVHRRALLGESMTD
jgi:hypothetical protein